MRKFFVVLLSLSLLLPLPAFAAEQGDLLQKIDALSKELDRLKQQMQEMQNKESVKEERITTVEKKAEAAAEPSWLTIGGDFRARFDSLHAKSVDIGAGKVMFGIDPRGKNVANDNLMTNRFGLNLQAKATEDVTVKARLLMYKVWGHESEAPAAAGSNPGGNAFFADRFFNFDGNIGHIPKDNTLRVDQAYATWSNIGGVPLWFSIGRRPSTGGVPTNIKQNVEKVGSAGTPGLLIDYAFDGGTIGYAPDIDALPGAFAKFCFGKGFDSGFRLGSNNSGTNAKLNDVWFVGFNVTPYDTDNFHTEIQYSRAIGIFAFPESNVFSGVNNTNVGDIDQLGAVISGKINNLGIGDLNLFLSPAVSKTHPNDNAMGLAPGNYGLLWDPGTEKKSRTGYAVYLGGRYDIKKTGTKLGLEYNHGTKNWITFAPAADDLWTGKLGTRGNVYEAYIIQELNKKPIAKRGNAFFRLGYQYYDFKYTGSNNWIGAPYKVSDLSTSFATPQMFAPLKKANDIYLTFDVLF
ncbi:MAG: DUF3373 domain-containing protein [Nitrospirae bacterium]|nr:DUF3373 domain-containing protein [Nitrospirota bacterium]